MANKFFNVHNGLVAGPVTIDATSGNIVTNSTTTSNSTTTGALIVTGGAGIGGNLYVGGEIVAQKLTIQLTTVTTTLIETDDIIRTVNTTQSTSTSTGALQVAGGAGIGGNLWVGGTINANVQGTISTATNALNVSTVARGGFATSQFLTYVDSNNASTSSEALYTTSSVFITSTGGIGAISNVQPFSFESTDSTKRVVAAYNNSTVIIEGLTINRAINSNLQFYFQGTGFTKFGGDNFTFPARLTTAGISDDSTSSSFAALNSSNSTLFLVRNDGNIGIGLTAPTSKLHVSGDARITGITTITNTTSATSTTTGALQVIGGVGIGGNLYVGGTIFGNINATVNTATNATNIATVAQTTSATHFLTFVDSNNLTSANEAVYTTSTFVINPATGFVGIGVTSPETLFNVQTTGATSAEIRASGVNGIVSAHRSSGNPNGPSFILNKSRGNAFTKAAVNSGDTLGQISFQAFDGTNDLTASFIRSIVDTYTTVSNVSSYLAFGTSLSFGGTERMRIDSVGRVGIGTTTATSLLHVNGTTLLTGVTTVTNTTAASSTVTGALIVNGGIGVGNNVYIAGSLFATTKSFLIDHPTKPGKKLRYGSLEGPENGVYVRGRVQGTEIELPEYWVKLVDPESITVNLTPIGRGKMPRINSIENNRIYLSKPWFGQIDCYYIVFAERNDIEKLEPEI